MAKHVEIPSYSGLSTVLFLSFLTFVSSFLAGVLPLSVTLSARRLRVLTSLGAGLLVGTALVVIIPEGIGALYSWEKKYESHESSKKKGQEEQEHGTELGTVIGLALVLGFVGMYIVDVWPTVAASSGQKDSSWSSSSHEMDSLPLHEASSSQGLVDNTLASGQEPKSPYPNAPSSPPASKASILTTGLLIHSLLDGVALGTSASLPSAGLVVFFAILVHKAPAAFGLTTSLLRQGLHKRGVRTYLLLFSAAAPVGAVASWFLIHLLGSSSSVVGPAEGREEWWAGVGMVLSGGTFLYVAVHSMIMAMESNGGGSGHGHEMRERTESQAAKAEFKKLARMDMIYTVLGMLLPLLTRVGTHGHAH
jgi:zinc transporter 9